MTAVGERAGSVFDRVKDAAGLIAPITLATALLFYFGYIATRARFEYFGVNLDLADLSNQALVLSGLEVVYGPTALFLLAVVAVVAIHAGVLWLLAEPGRDRIALLLAALAGTVSVILITRAVVGLLVVHVATEETPGKTPLLLAGGPGLLGYATWIAARVTRRRSDRFDQWYRAAVVRRLRLTGLGAIVALCVAGLFWAANSFAWAYGASRGYEDALGLPTRPEIILDTVESLGDMPAGVDESLLPAATGATYRYRYRGLRLLVASSGRMFLVPAQWTSAGRTFVVPLDATARIQVAPSPGTVG